MRLIGNRVLVQLAPIRRATAAGILTQAELMPIPQTVGKVVAIGPKVRAVKPGEVVALAPEAFVDDVTGIEGLCTPHVIVRDVEIDVLMEAR